MKHYINIFVLILTVQSMTIAQGGWARQKDSYFLKLDLSAFGSDQYYTPTGLHLTTSKFQQQSLGFYGEYGITDQLGIIASVPILRRQKFETTNAVIGQGDLSFSVKYSPFKYKQYVFPLAIFAGIDAPTGRANAFAESFENADERINLPTGDGEWNFPLGAAISIPIGRKAYWPGHAMYNIRTKYEGLDFRDLYSFGTELGFNPLKNLWINGKMRMQFSNGTSVHPELGFVRGDGTTFTAYSVEAFYKFSDHYGFSLTYSDGIQGPSKPQNLYLGKIISLGFIMEKAFDFEKLNTQ